MTQAQATWVLVDDIDDKLADETIILREGLLVDLDAEGAPSAVEILDAPANVTAACLTPLSADFPQLAEMVAQALRGVGYSE